MLVNKAMKQNDHQRRMVLYSISMHIYNTMCTSNGLDSLVRRAFASKLRGPGFKSSAGTAGGPVGD